VIKFDAISMWHVNKLLLHCWLHCCKVSRPNLVAYFIGDLYLSGVQLDMDLRMETKEIRLQKRLDYRVNCKVKEMKPWV
jgi:hypothetical protein